MRSMQPSPQGAEASIAGISGLILHEDASAALWEVRVEAGSVADGVARLLEACQGGTVIDVVAGGRVLRALARQWWVLPLGADMVVRVALEKVNVA